MAKWLTNYLILISFLCGFSGCTAVKHLSVMDIFTICPPICQQRITTATYSSQIDFYKKHFSGLLVFKTIDDTTKRAVFITETGFKFFDFEFSPHHFRVVYILPNLNKKIIVNTFRKDLGYLLQNLDEKKGREQPKSEQYTIFKVAGKEGGYDYFYADKNCDKLLRIEHGNEKHKSLSISFDGMKNGNFETVKIVHTRLKLSLVLKQIAKEEK